MTNKILTAFFLIATFLGAQTPALRPGEGLTVINHAGEVKEWGNVSALTPMGNLAKLLWLHLEAEEWESAGVEYRCSGELNGIRCAKKHGRVDLTKSFKEDCNTSFYLWVNLSRERWKKDYKDAGARLRLNNVFGVFLGDRLPKEPALPDKFGSEWFNDGNLLQASPNLLASWLARPAQERLLRACRKFLLGFTDFAFGKDDKWWIKVSVAPTGLQDGQTQFWVVGSNASNIAVLRLPPGDTEKIAQSRFKALLNIK
ncbi:MAG: hypothetical protein FWG02_07540 [Holophagaceae bacterium]|nr:hypothetical protein [Holophagaceae bacterium]